LPKSHHKETRTPGAFTTDEESQLNWQNEIQNQKFHSWLKEARRTLCTTAYGQPARRAYDMGRKLSNRFMDLLKVVQMA